MIKSLHPKQQHIMVEWLDEWCKYLSFEKSFVPQKLKFYKRGDIVLAHFGYNIGSELGGTHYAVVVEKDNNKASNTVTVVPLSSLADDKTQEDLHKSEVYLGKIFPNSDKQSYAKPLQIRAVSKIRIIKPKTTKDNQYKLNGSQLQQIDDKIKELFTK
ncbi:MAG: type II toxin-antitoxin system PemK/MazF family toxin [Ruminococcus sp.]|nr:type II toxin-antitoxin system PemK/MazF family toxin [Ruminococcus sp.]